MYRVSPELNTVSVDLRREYDRFVVDTQRVVDHLQTLIKIQEPRLANPETVGSVLQMAAVRSSCVLDRVCAKPLMEQIEQAREKKRAQKA